MPSNEFKSNSIQRDSLIKPNLINRNRIILPSVNCLHDQLFESNKN